MKLFALALSLFVANSAYAQTPPLRLNGDQIHALSAAPGTPTASNPVTWVDLSTRFRLSDGTNNLYIPACTPSVSGQVCTWNGSAWTASTPSPKLQTVYNNGASVTDSTILLDSTRRYIQIQDYGDAAPGFSVTNGGGTTAYFQVLGSTASPSYQGIRVYQHINAWNSNTLFIGDDGSNTTGVTIGSSPQSIDVTIGRNLTVNNNLNTNGVDRANAGVFTIAGTNATSVVVGGANITGGISFTGTLSGGNGISFTGTSSTGTGLVFTAGNAANAGTAVLFNTSATWTGGNYMYRFQNNGATIVLVDSNGQILTGLGIDRYGTGVLNIGVTAATGVVISKAGATTTVQGPLQSTGTTFASLGTPANGTLIYCSDCVIAATCAGSGTGAFAKRLAAVWVCN